MTRIFLYYDILFVQVLIFLEKFSIDKSILHQIGYPTDLIELIFPGKDSLVCNVEVSTIKHANSYIYVRPVTQILLLCHSTV